MIIQFKNRIKELKEIKEITTSKKTEFVIIYGRRRVGKTELILHATKNKKMVYYLAVGENNLDRFYDTCVKFDKEAENLKKDWEVLFNLLKDKADIVVIDEFQNMIKENENILNIFQFITDTVIKDSKLKFFLLSSSVSIISSKVLSYKSPLYGRRTGSINLKPVSFFDLQKFFPKFSMEELVNIYGFADGIPFYLIKINKKFWKWFSEEIIQEKSFLRDEIDFLIRYEFVDPGTYKLILEAISNGKTKLNEIKDFAKLKRTDLGPYIRNLIDVGFIERKVPINENIKSRHGRYFISDNFIKFWFRFIYPNLSSIEEGIFDPNTIKREYNKYLGFVFENICKQFLIKLQPISFSKIGNWWHKDKEIDLVCLNEQKKEALFVECKWSNLEKKEVRGVLEKLKEKTKFFEWERKKEHYGIIGKKIREKEKLKKEGFFVWDLDDFQKI